MADGRLIYRDVAPGAREAAEAAAADRQPFSNPGDILQDVEMPHVATLEQDYWRLDGTFDLFPDEPEGMSWGLWSRSMAGADGVFAAPPLLVLQLDGLYTSIGLTLDFDADDPCWCRDLTVTWYRGGTVLDRQSYQPTDPHHIIVHTVELYDRIEVSFRAMSKPWRYLKLRAFDFGIIRIFRANEFFGLTFVQELSAISEELPINTLSCSLRNTSAIPFLFQRAQPLEAWDGEELLGVYYITTASRTGRYAYDIASVDLLGRLEDADGHMGGIYSGTLSGAVIADIMGDVPYELDPVFATVPIYGWLPIAARRENLAQVAFALGAAVDTSRSHAVRIFPLPTEITSTPGMEDRVYSGGSIETAPLVTGVQITEHNFTPINETVELFSGTVDGTATVPFNEPVHTLTITGGTIMESGANHAVIAGNGAITLSGRRYAHNTKNVRKDNPLVPAGDPRNIVEVTDATLVGAYNSAAVIRRVYDRYTRRETVKQKIVLKGERPGDRVRTDSAFEGEKTGVILSLDITLSGTTAAEAVILCE